MFNRENPQNSEPKNGQRRGLDFIALGHNAASWINLTSFRNQYSYRRVQQELDGLQHPRLAFLIFNTVMQAAASRKVYQSQESLSTVLPLNDLKEDASYSRTREASWHSGMFWHNFFKLKKGLTYFLRTLQEKQFEITPSLKNLEVTCSLFHMRPFYLHPDF